MPGPNRTGAIRSWHRQNTSTIVGVLSSIDEPVTYGNDSLDALAHYWLSRPATIYGGSSEVQRNIVAKQVLDLPG